MKRFICADVMSANLRCFERVNRVSDVVRMLQYTPHNGFPIVEPLTLPGVGEVAGRFRSVLFSSAFFVAVLAFAICSLSL